MKLSCPHGRDRIGATTGLGAVGCSAAAGADDNRTAVHVNHDSLVISIITGIADDAECIVGYDNDKRETGDEMYLENLEEESLLAKTP